MVPASLFNPKSDVLAELILKDLFEFVQFWCNHEGAVALLGIVGKIILVVVFRRVKLLEFSDFGFNRIRVSARFVQFSLGRLGKLLLLVGMLKND